MENDKDIKIQTDEDVGLNDKIKAGAESNRQENGRPR